MAALSAVRAHRGTEGSNPLSSTRESANFWFLSGGAPISLLDGGVTVPFVARYRKEGPCGASARTSAGSRQ